MSHSELLLIYNIPVTPNEFAIPKGVKILG